jgi:hypothetical protein
MLEGAANAREAGVRRSVELEDALGTNPRDAPNRTPSVKSDQTTFLFILFSCSDLILLWTVVLADPVEAAGHFWYCLANGGGW